MNCIWCGQPIRRWQRSLPNLSGRYTDVAREHVTCQEQRLDFIRKSDEEIAPILRELVASVGQGDETGST